MKKRTQRTAEWKMFLARSESARVAWRTSLLYWSVAMLWILLSDRIVGAIIADPEIIIRVQMIKGWAFVTVTAAFLFVRMRSQLQRWEMEITGRKKAEEALRESVVFNQIVLQTIPFGMTIVDQKGNLLFISPTLEAVAGKNGVGQKCWDVYKDNQQQCSHCPLSRKIVHGETNVVETEGVLGERTFQISHTGMEFRGKPALLEIFQDITERKRAEEALKQSEKRYRSLFDNMLDGYAYCQMLFDHDEPQDFVYIDVNSAFESLTGLKNVVGKKVSEVIPGIKESNPDLFKIYGRVALTGAPERFETYLESLVIWFSVAVYSPAKGYFVAVFDNITERKQAETEIQTLAKIPEENPNPVLRVARDGVLIYANKASVGLLECWDCSVGQRVPKTWGELILETLNSGLPKEEETICRELVFSMSLAPIAGFDYVNIYGRNITERKHTEAELRRHVEELRSRNDELERFNRASAGRELRMIELKKRVNELCRQLGQPPPYSLDFASGMEKAAT